MKRILSIIFCLALIAAMAFTVVACGPKEEPECQHEYSSKETTPATCSAEGVKTYTCVKEGCGHSYTEPIAPIPHTEEVVDAVPVTCTTDGSNPGKKCSVCGTVTLAGAVIKAEGHKYVDQRCTECGEFHPDADLTIYTFDANDMEVTGFDGKDGSRIEVGTDGFLTIITKDTSKIEKINKPVEYDDGYVANNRLSIGGKVNWTTEKDADGAVIRWYVNKTALEFTVDKTAVVKIWWMAGKPSGTENGDPTGRYIGIQSVDGVTSSAEKNDCVAQTEAGVVNGANYDEFVVEAGSYYISNLPTDSTGGNNYIFKIEVIVVNN